MSKESDTQLSINFKRQVINNNISIEMCKECTYFNSNNLLCKMTNIIVEKCNLLKTFYGI